MGKVILEPAMLARLNGTDIEQELATPDGTTVGFFVPADEFARLKQLAADHKRKLDLWGLSQLTAEELDRAFDGPERFTTAEVLKHLESQ